MKIYYSHRISGGCVDPVEAQKKYCAEAQRIADEISRAIPVAELYVPGGPTEEFVRRAYGKGFITVEQILEIDCDVLANMDLVLCHVPEGDTLQGGRQIEVEYAAKIGKPYYVFDTAENAIIFLEHFMTGH